MYDASTLFVQLLNGLSYSSTLFLVASGLALIFGVSKIVNFAHGSFYMLGAYIALTVTAMLPSTVLGFWGGVLISALAVGLAGCLIEVTILRRIYRAPEVFQILVTFGLVLVFQNLIFELWGPDERLAPRVPGLKGVVTVFGERIPEYNIALIFVGPIFLGVLWWLTHRTRWGRLIRAATQDREMVASLGVNQKTLFTVVFFIGTFLAGLAGALQIPKETANLQMDINIVVEAFVIVVIGGMGSIMGAFLAAILVGFVNAFGILFFPQAVSVLIFLVMVLILIFRPNGLLGSRLIAQRPGDLSIDLPFRLPGRAMQYAMLAIVIACALLPLFAPLYMEVVMTEVFILAIFAGSLHFLLSVGGDRIVRPCRLLWAGVICGGAGSDAPGPADGAGCRGGDARRRRRRPAIRLVLHPAERRVPGDADSSLRADPVYALGTAGVLYRWRQRTHWPDASELAAVAHKLLLPVPGRSRSGYLRAAACALFAVWLRVPVGARLIAAFDGCGDQRTAYAMGGFHPLGCFCGVGRCVDGLSSRVRLPDRFFSGDHGRCPRHGPGGRSAVCQWPVDWRPGLSFSFG